MKKLVLLLAVVFSVSLFSCGNAEKAETADTTATDSAVVENVDSAATDSAAVEAPAEEVK